MFSFRIKEVVKMEKPEVPNPFSVYAEAVEKASLPYFVYRSGESIYGPDIGDAISFQERLAALVGRRN